ncbi:MAG: hypothetical protein ACLR8Y_09270 [Alistipes indistinctus]
MKKRITEQDYLKAHRKASREEEIARHGHPVGQSRVHRSKRAYDRKRRRQASNACLFDFPATGYFDETGRFRAVIPMPGNRSNGQKP